MKYISLKDYEVYDEKPKDIECFNVDDMIANTISILNKKGYTTLYSCSGHEKAKNLTRYEVDEKDFNLEEATKNGYKVIEKVGSTYTLEGYAEVLSCYVKFQEKFEFPNIPEKFVLEGDTIYAFIYYYTYEGNEKFERDKSIVESEIKELNNILYSWSLELPYLKPQKLL